MAHIDITELGLTTLCDYIMLSFYLYKIWKDDNTFICLQFTFLLSFLKTDLSISFTFLRVVDYEQILNRLKVYFSFLKKKRKEREMGIFIKNVEGQLCKSSRETPVVTLLNMCQGGDEPVLLSS